MDSLAPKGFLDNKEIKEKLQRLELRDGSKLKQGLIDDIIQQFWFRDFYNSFISRPVFLEVLKAYLKGRPIDEFNRYDFYRYFFESLASGSGGKQALKDLKRLALVFELMHTDQLAQPDFEGVIGRLKPKVGGFAKWLEDQELIEVGRDEKGKAVAKWTHHTLTEYLAAEHILEQKDPLGEAKRLMILEIEEGKEKITALKPSWMGVLRFLLEGPSYDQFVKFFVQFAQANPRTIDDDFSEVLTSVKGNLGQVLKGAIFDLVYQTYQERRLWLPVWARKNLAKFIDPERLAALDNDLKESQDDVETFVKRGNVVAVVDGLLEANSELIDKQTRGKWLERLIKYANDDNPNGVLQRHSLEALRNFKNETNGLEIVKKVAGTFESEDQLIIEAFIRLCSDLAPNDSFVIEKLVKAIERGFDIYGRHGLYEIASPNGVTQFLNLFINDAQFLKRFLDRESIFSAREEKGDQILLENISKAVIADKKLIGIIKRLLKTAYRSKDSYYAEKSYFLRYLAKIIKKYEPDFLLEVVGWITPKKGKSLSWREFSYFEPLFIELVDEKHIEAFHKALLAKNEELGKREFDLIIYAAKREGKESAYNKAVGLKFVTPLEKLHDPFKRQQEKQKQEVYDQFSHSLTPKKDHFIPDVFRLFLNNQELIKEYWKRVPSSKKAALRRLIKLIKEQCLEKIDPRQIRVWLDKERGGREGPFKWSTPAAYFGDAIRVAQILIPSDLKAYRQKLIDFIPFAFSNDQSTILEIVNKVSGRELKWVDKIMSDESDNRRYLIPSGYIYLIKEYAIRGCSLPRSVNVLWSLVEDDYLSNSDRRYALEALGKLIDGSSQANKEKLTSLFEGADGESLDAVLGETANEILIEKFKDERAIRWRFEQLKSRICRFERRYDGKARSISPQESEIGSMSFAKSLIELGEERYLDNFFDLLEYSLGAIKDDQVQYWEYVNYLWRVTIGFVKGLIPQGSFGPVSRLESWANDHIKEGNESWFNARVGELRSTFINELGKAKDLSHALSVVEEVKPHESK